ncbi:MAG: hypothetical protein ACXWNX_16475, partial [Isosphaeraceae bacterium]
MASEITPAPSSAILDLSGLPEPVVKSIKQLVESLREGIASQGHSGATPQPSPLRGRFADLKLSIPTEDIDEAQREAWQDFPRELPEPGAPPRRTRAPGPPRPASWEGSSRAVRLEVRRGARLEVHTGRKRQKARPREFDRPAGRGMHDTSTAEAAEVEAQGAAAQRICRHDSSELRPGCELRSGRVRSARRRSDSSLGRGVQAGPRVRDLSGRCCADGEQHHDRGAQGQL